MTITPSQFAALHLEDEGRILAEFTRIPDTFSLVPAKAGALGTEPVKADAEAGALAAAALTAYRAAV